ncbi:MAG: DUF4340 domain-containing protein [Pseudomonadales bacterium]|jgi:hypothetical protein|nr:DUF4340 domain-containing protein [Pseudomonadales bacterium]MDP7359689.1 DUF4340 domain-containing protein [Pseudomonadales bacterium]MDP7595158.1 DUF4340 domain-containing protein [Pseudomonadales bacterium]HJN50320.1 DUF4340 domain-containing protein [Pseudomonadales bacterium]|tara:strand:- start:638 stop:1753 length:1116 start_codon:yes stop_codon:yes gene_type:complete
MNSKTIGILAAIIVCSVVIVYVSDRPAESADPLLGTPVLPDLKNRLEEVREVDIVSREGDVMLALREDFWVVANRDDYPASFDKLSDLLDNLTEANIAERKTGKPEYFDRLGLRDLDHQESQAVRVKIVTGAEEPLELLVGKAATNREGQYFRFTAEQQAWLMSTQLDVEAKAEDWLKPTIINIESERVTKVTQTSASGEQLTVVREGGEEENFEVVDLPAGKKLKYGTVANALGRSLVNVRLKDVKKADGFDLSGSGKAEYWCKDGLVIRVLAKEMDGQYYLNFAVDTDVIEEVAGEASDEQDSGEDSESELASEEESDQISLPEEVATLKRDLDSWVFEVTQFTFEDFTKTLDDLVEEEEEPAESTDSQ